MLLHRVALLIVLLLINCSFVVAKYQLRNNVLYDHQNNQVPTEKYVYVFNYWMWDCATEYNETIAEWLINNGLGVNARDNLPFRCAARNGHTTLVEKLLKYNEVDPASNDNYAIKWASEYSHSEILKLLLNDSRADPSTNDNGAIRWASRNGHIAVVKLLLNDSRVDPSAKDNEAIRYASLFGHAAVVELLLTNFTVDATKALEKAIRSKNYGTVSIINKARPKLLIDENIMNLANKTIQVNTTISVENNKLIVNYVSEYDYRATLLLSSMSDDSTIYLNVKSISNGELSIAMKRLSKSSEWNWRWICAKHSIESTGQFQISPNSITIKDNVIYWNNSNLIGFDLPAKITYNNSVLYEIDSIIDKNNVTLDSDKMTVIEVKEYDLLFECWGTKIIIISKVNSALPFNPSIPDSNPTVPDSDKSNMPDRDNSDSNNSTIPDVAIVTDEKKFIFWIIAVSSVLIIAMTFIVYLCIRSRRRQSNLARLRAFGNGKLHIFHIGPVETIGSR